MTLERRSIPVAQPFISGNEAKYVSDCLETGWISSIGRYVSEFESVFAEFCGVRYAATCNNGTSALHLALLAMGVEAGDEVLVPTLTYVATANAVRYCGATPVFVDSDPVTMNLDPADIEHRLTPRTRGVIAVHLYGHPAAMSEINAVAKRHGLWVIEDAAEAHGARCDGSRTGSLSDVATFSFFGNKIVTTGEGGMVTTDDAEVDARVRLLRGQGMDTERRYWFPVVGFNYRMTNIQAALGLAQLEMIDTQLIRRREIARWYDADLHRLEVAVTPPPHEPWAEPVNWLYTILLEGDGDEARRDALMAALAGDGVETRPVFYPVHTLPPYREAMGTFPVAERLAANGVSLPTHAALTRDDVSYVVESIARHLGRG